eukprot:292096_1
MPNKIEITLHHGVNRQFIYSSLFPYIKGPFSTTTDYAVALNFCSNQGMVIGLCLKPRNWYFNFEDDAIKRDSLYSNNNRIAFMDMMWISEYKNEHEIFTIGGLYPFQFDNIIEPRHAITYRKYIQGIKHAIYGMYFDCMVGAYPKTAEEDQLAFRLMAHELSRYYPNNPELPEWKTCPQYIKELLHSQCMNVQRITFTVTMHKSKLHKHMLFHQNGWIKIDIIMTVFKNVKHIMIGINNYTELKKPYIYESMLTFIQTVQQNDQKLALQNVKIVLGNIDKIQQEEVQKYAKQYVTKFNQYLWDIYIEANEDVYGVLDSIEECPQAMDYVERNVILQYRLISYDLLLNQDTQ